MDYLLVAAALAGLIVLIAVVFFFLSKSIDSITSAFLARKARRALSRQGYQATVAAIDSKLEALEADIRRSKERAAQLAGMGHISGPYEGVYNEIRWLQRFKAAVEQAHRANP